MQTKLLAAVQEMMDATTGCTISHPDGITAALLAIEHVREAVEEMDCDDPRPSDLAEIARQTAIELRRRGIYAEEQGGTVRLPGVDYASQLCWHVWQLAWTQFDDLGPIGCADLIQRLESAMAQQWAGDK